jgi:hypothetical protein
MAAIKKSFVQWLRLALAGDQLTALRLPSYLICCRTNLLIVSLDPELSVHVKTGLGSDRSKFLI